MVMLGKDDPKLQSTTSTPFEATRRGAGEGGVPGDQRVVSEYTEERRAPQKGMASLYLSHGQRSYQGDFACANGLGKPSEM